MTAADDPVASGSAEHFPGSNPHPVMRVAEDGRLTYANASCGPLIATIGVRVGEMLPAAWQERLATAAASSKPIELRVGPRTFELLAVRLPELGFLNVYGTDVTAARAVVKFPDQNPNPVFRLTWDGTLVYANPASRQLVEGQGWVVGTPLADPILQPLLASARAGEGGTVEVVGVDRRYRLLAVDVPEFGFINVYGTDVTAVHDLEEAHRENERLLLNILPEPIADRLRRGERPIADRFEDVSLLFADIVGFTSLSGGMGAHELVSVLNEVFSVFDELVDGAGLEKVKTIGDTVNIASRMESTGVPGRIQVTAAVEVRLRGGFQFDPRGLTEIRGKGPMSTFFLVGEAGGSLGAALDMVGP